MRSSLTALLLALACLVCLDCRAQQSALTLSGGFTYSFYERPGLATLHFSGRISNPTDKPSGRVALALEAVSTSQTIVLGYGREEPSLPPGGAYTKLDYEIFPSFPQAPDYYRMRISLLEECPTAPDRICRAGTITAPGLVILPPRPISTTNYSDLWWNPDESGWGLTIADHEQQMFAVWYTYDGSGQPTWFVIPGGTLSEDRRILEGDVYQTTGPSFRSAFDPNRVTRRLVGAATIAFFDSGPSWLAYTVNGIAAQKQIFRQPFGDAAPQWGADLTDLWWDEAESGWGLTISQHGNNLFATWYTYDDNGRPLFVVLPGGTFTGTRTFTGKLYTTTGPAFGSVFNPSLVRVVEAGTGTISFEGSGTSAKAFLPKRGRFTGTLRGTAFSKSITQQLFAKTPPEVAPNVVQLVVSVAGPGVGSVSSSPAGIACPPACTASFPRGSSVTLFAKSGVSSWFGAFTGYCSTPVPSCIVSMGTSVQVTATFIPALTASDLTVSVPDSLPDATIGQPYATQAITASKGSSPYHYELDTFANGAPPPLLTLEPVTGRLSGTVSSSLSDGQVFAFQVCAVDNAATRRCGPTRVTVRKPSSPGGFSPKNCTGTFQGTFNGSPGNGCGPRSVPVSSPIVIENIDWQATGTQEAAATIDRFAGICTTFGGGFQFFEGFFYFPRLTTTRDSTGTIVGVGSDTTRPKYTGTISFRVPGGNTVEGTLSGHITEIGDYTVTGNFTCTPAP